MSDGATTERLARFAADNQAAREAMMRADGQRTLGENLEQADALIRAAFELARGGPSQGQ